MTFLAVLSAMLAVWLVVPIASTRRLARLTEADDPAPRRPQRWYVRVGGGVLLLVAGGFLVDGSRGVALTCVVGCVVGTVAAIVRKRSRAAVAAARRASVARGCEVLASLVRIGHIPTAALLEAARDCPELGRAAALTRVGGEPVPVLRDEGRLPGAAGLVAIAHAWEVSVETGAPVVAALEAVTAELRRSRDLAHVVNTELAAPRATGQLLGVLPFAGIGLGLALGGDPIGFLTGSVVGQICLVAGVGLAGVGVLWSEALADRAADSAGV